MIIKVFNQVFHHVLPNISNSADGSPDQTVNRIIILVAQDKIPPKEKGDGGSVVQKRPDAPAENSPW